MSKRLLHIIESLSASEVAQQLVLLARGLRDEFDLHLCALRGGPMLAELRAAGFDVQVFPQRMPLDPFNLVRLRRHIRSLHPDLVQTWQWPANGWGRIAAIAANAPRIVAVERELDAWKRWPHWQMDRRLARRTGCLVFSSAGVREYYQAHGVEARSHEIIADGIAAAEPTPQTRSELLEELELPKNACLIAACAPLRNESCWKDLIWALDILKWVYEDAHLLIIGDGPQRRSLMRYVDCVEVEDCVHFLGQRSDAEAIIASSDFYWDSALRDGAAQPLLQARAAGVPVVAVDTPMHRTLVQSGESGYLVEAQDRPAFARWTHRMLQDASLRQRIATARRDRIREQFSSARLIERYRSLYHRLLS